MSIIVRLAVLAVFVVATTASARAADKSYDDTVFGTWGGLRSSLHDEGIDLGIEYKSETASNVRGGPKTGVRYTDQWAFGARLDLQKLLGLYQAQFQISITDRNGRNLSSDLHLNTLQLVQEVFGRGQTWRITQFWYDQAYLDGALDWKIGRLTVGEDFASFSCEFMNLTFCGSPPGNLVGSYWFNWPVSQWASRLKGTVPDIGYVEVAAYQVNPNWLTRRYAFSFDNPGGTTGALIPAEVGWEPSFSAAQLKGSYKFGAWYNTSKTADVVENTQGQLLSIAGGQPRTDNGAHGVYINFVQKLTPGAAANPDQGVSGFLNATLADRRTAMVDNQIAFGIFDTGPFDNRPKDALGLAFGLTHVNGRFATAQELQNAAGLGPVGIQHTEYVGEVYYRLYAGTGINLYPDLQYIRDPGGVTKSKDVIIIGLKVNVSL
jgi:porin